METFIVIVIAFIFIYPPIERYFVHKIEVKKFNNGICKKCNIPFELLYNNGNKRPPAFRKDGSGYFEEVDRVNKNPEFIPYSIYKCPKCKRKIVIETETTDHDVFVEKLQIAGEEQAKQQNSKLGMSEDVQNYWD